MTRPAECCIDLDALRHNYALLRQRHGGRALAVLKADAYGHGALRCAQALSGGAVRADAFAVAFADEAFALRQAGIDAPILVLEGAFDATELRAMQAAGLWTVVHHAPQLEMLQALPRDAAMPVWLKVDSGMHRAGFAPHEAAAVWRQLRELPAVGDITLMSHFACADEPANPFTAAQMACFDDATAGLPGPRSLANSAAILAWPQARRDWSRPGIALYGADPLLQPDAHGLRPVMTLRSRVFAVREVEAGESVGYGQRWRAARRSRIGLVALGYADGYPRHIAEHTPVAVDGALSHIVGRVSMDMLSVDLTHLPRAGIGSTVECWGAQVPVNAVAGAAGTIAYELLCGVKRVRVHALGMA